MYALFLAEKKNYVSYVSTYIPINYFFQAGRNIPCLKHNTNYTHIHKLKPFIIFASIKITSFTSGFLLGIWIIIGCLCICRIKKVIKKLQKTVKPRQKQEVVRAFKKWRGNLDTYMTQVFPQLLLERPTAVSKMLYVRIEPGQGLFICFNIKNQLNSLKYLSVTNYTLSNLRSYLLGQRV